MADSLPVGIYDRLVDRQLAEALARLPDGLRQEIQNIDPAELPSRVSELAAKWIADALERVASSTRGAEAVDLLGQIGHVIQPIAGKGDSVALDLSAPAPIRSLKSIAELDPTGNRRVIPRPVSPIRDTFLLTNARSEPAVGHELASEIASADRIDVIMAFIRWSGIRLLMEPLRAHVERGRPLRILTTAYTGSTERRALEELEQIGAEIRVSYDTTTTRLHAKAWLFSRDTGFSTAYVGSSNLTHSAQVTGVEWNVRASEVSSSLIVEKFQMAFETYWEDPNYERFDPDRFQAATAAARRDGVDEDLAHLVAIRPYPFQRAMLEQLAVEREQGHTSNLVVAATGTGKTVVAALDYKAMRATARDAGSSTRLLFVAHRKEILRQSRDMFRHVLSDGAFGELWVDGDRPEKWDYVFASIQSISVGDIRNLAPDHFDVVIVDEFHHAAAKTYNELLAYVQPDYLLGLTATPERTDEQDILGHFEGRIAVELRLWDALEQGLLVPFHYFGIHDGTDLSSLPWKRGYSPADLENVYTANDLWADKVRAAVKDKVSDVRQMRALGFCASVGHARFMASFFEKRGLRAVGLDGSSPAGERSAALKELKAGTLQAVFAVDLFNEGLDIPGIDTVLMLRPTESATLFLQQLGRGLRRTDDKDVLTVLDFVGHQHKRFRFDQRFRKLLGRTRKEIIDDLENGFPFLPAGTQIHLDRESREIVLGNVKESLPTTWPKRVAELKELVRLKGADVADASDRNLGVSLPTYLEHTGLDLTDVYYGGHSWTELRVAARVAEHPVAYDVTGRRRPEELEKRIRTLLRGTGRLLHVDDPSRIDTWIRYLTDEEAPTVSELAEHDRRLLEMLALVLFSPSRKSEFSSLGEALALLWSRDGETYPIRNELRELLAILAKDRTHRQSGLGLSSEIPLLTHARYTRDEVFAALGIIDVTNPGSFREGVYYDRGSDLDVFFVTLQKTEKDFSPLTRYRDYAISDTLFHWESQHTTTVASPTGQRYINQVAGISNVVLFIRETNKTPDGRTAPFFCCGLADYVSHRASEPIQMTWRLRTPLPGDVFAAYRAAVA